jgi:hypothetical protein
MGTNAAVLWQKAAELLQESSSRQTNSADVLLSPYTLEAQPALRRVHDLLEKLHNLPTPPKAVWKKVVQQLQVMLCTGYACVWTTGIC